MVRLGLDQSLRCSGVSIVETLGQHQLVLYSGTIHTEKTLADNYEDVFKRSMDITDAVSELVDRYDVDEVYLEGLSFGSSGNATRDLAILLGMLVRSLKENNVKVVVITPPALKKFATGTGIADKEMMLAAVGAKDPAKMEEFLKIPKTKGRYDLAGAYWLSFYKG